MKDEIDALNAFSLSLSNTHSPLLFFLCDMEVGKKKGEIGRVSSSSGLEENRKNPSIHPPTDAHNANDSFHVLSLLLLKRPCVDIETPVWLCVCVCERTKSWEILSLEIFISSFWS